MKPKTQKEETEECNDYSIIPRGWWLLPISPEAKALGALMLSWAAPFDGNCSVSPSLHTMDRWLGHGKDSHHRKLKPLLKELVSVGAINLKGSIPKKKGETWDLSVVWNRARKLNIQNFEKDGPPMTPEVLRSALIDLDMNYSPHSDSRMSDEALMVYRYVVRGSPIELEAEPEKVKSALQKLLSGEVPLTVLKEKAVVIQINRES